MAVRACIDGTLATLCAAVQRRVSLGQLVELADHRGPIDIDTEYVYWERDAAGDVDRDQYEPVVLRGYGWMLFDLRDGV